ncbi:MAG: hypothetical protein ACOZQL_10910 [Myxococcota bacterium]
MQPKQKQIEAQLETGVVVVTVKPTRLRPTPADVSQDGRSIPADRHIALALQGQCELDVSFVRSQRDFSQTVFRGIDAHNYSTAENRALVKQRAAAFARRAHQ